MYEAMNQIFEDYIKAKDTDYAIFVDGEWGSGKTYYFQHCFKKLCPDSLRPVYVSLNGLSDFDELKKDIFLGSFDSSINSSYIKFAGNLISCIPKFGVYIHENEGIGKVFETIVDGKNKKFLADAILILDDFERISSKVGIGEILGFISTNFVEKNIKTIVIGNTAEINEISGKNVFSKKKEKIFRRIIRFNPNTLELFQSFSRQRLIGQPDKEILITTISDNISFFEDSHKNLRTLDFIIDSYLKITLNSSSVILPECDKKCLFMSIAILAIEYKNGSFTYEDLEDRKKLDQIKSYQIGVLFSSGMNSSKEEKKEKEPEYHERFYEKYIKGYGLNFKFIGSIYDYIITGYLNSDKLVTELNNVFEYEADEAAILKQLCSYNSREMEFEDLDIALAKMIAYLKDGKYKFVEISKAYHSLKHSKETVYKEDWVFDDVENIITQAFSAARKNDNIGEIYNPDFPKKIKESEEDKFLNSINKILRDEFLIQEKCKQMILCKSFYESISKEGNEFFKVYNKIQGRYVFDLINDMKMFSSVLGLSNLGIHRFEQIIYTNILSIENIWVLHSSFKEPLSEIRHIIFNAIETRPKQFDLQRIWNFHSLIDQIDIAIKHLDETKRGED